MSKHIVITGANTGIGLATAKSLAAQGHHLIIACRDLNKAEVAATQIKQAGAASVDIVKLDLSDLASIKQTVANITAIFPSIDVLINNAGLFNHSYQTTAQGYESHFGVNVLGPILLTELLLPALKAAPKARIVNVASIAHLAGKIDPSSYKKPAKYRPIAAYGQSKLGNLLYSNALAARLKGSTVTSNALHPGAVNSDIYRALPRWQKVLVDLVLISPEIPAKLMTAMATSDNWQDKNGEYKAIQAPQYTAKCSRDADYCQRFDNDMQALLAEYL